MWVSLALFCPVIMLVEYVPALTLDVFVGIDEMYLKTK